MMGKGILIVGSGLLVMGEEDPCSFPMNVVILQDATASFGSMYEEMRTRQLRHVVEAINAVHPNSRFGLASFRDKPIGSLGDSQDYCYRVHQPATEGFEPIFNAYGELWSNGGMDPPENSFGALLTVALDDSVWNITNQQEREAARLIVVSTDAPPHYEDDGFNVYGLPPYPQGPDHLYAATSPELCQNFYYPSALEVKQAIQRRNTSVAFFIHDRDSKTLPVWNWFNDLLGQTKDFVTSADEASIDFFRNLASIIGSIEQEQCGQIVMTTPTPFPTAESTESTKSTTETAKLTTETPTESTPETETATPETAKSTPETAETSTKTPSTTPPTPSTGSFPSTGSPAPRSCPERTTDPCHEERRPRLNDEEIVDALKSIIKSIEQPPPDVLNA